MCQTRSVCSRIRMRTVSEAPVGSSNRHRSTASVCSLNRAKLTPLPSQVAPSGWGCPGDVLMVVMDGYRCEIRTGRRPSASAPPPAYGPLRPATRVTPAPRERGCLGGPASVAEALVDDVHQRLAPLEPTQVLLEDLPDQVHRDAGARRVVGRDDTVRRLPERVARRQGLDVGDVEAGAC